MNDETENVTANPKSWVAWKREAEELRAKLEEALSSNAQLTSKASSVAKSALDASEKYEALLRKGFHSEEELDASLTAALAERDDARKERDEQKTNRHHANERALRFEKERDEALAQVEALKKRLGEVHDGVSRYNDRLRNILSARQQEHDKDKSDFDLIPEAAEALRTQLTKLKGDAEGLVKLLQESLDHNRMGYGFSCTLATKRTGIEVVTDAETYLATFRAAHPASSTEEGA